MSNSVKEWSCDLKKGGNDMKKQLKNILIVLIIIIGILGAWFIKHKDNNEIENNVVDMQEDNKETEIENKVVIEEQSEDTQINEDENKEPEILEDVILDNIEKNDNKETEVFEDVVQDNSQKDNNKENIDSKEDNQPKIDVNDSNFNLLTPSFEVETLTSYGLPILLDFGAQWCGPCKKMHPILEELNSELRGKAIIKYVDIDDYPEATKDFDFTLIPTQYFITKDGEIYKTHTGIMKKEDVVNVLKEMGMTE